MTRGRRRLVITMMLLLFAATSWRAALAAPCDPAYVRAHHTTVVVLPSGGDDTANLQCAIDQATARGRGAIVQLFRWHLHDAATARSPRCAGRSAAQVARPPC